MRKIVLTALTVYQQVISPLIHQLLGINSGDGYGCRQTPTCSAYAQEAVKKYGVIKGIALSVHRLVNCQPLFSI